MPPFIVRKQAKIEFAQAERQKAKTLKEQAKLLQAHYADAVPLELMRSEQQRLEPALSEAERRLVASSTAYEDLAETIDHVLESAERWELAYLGAEADIRRQMNQAIFERIYVDDDGMITSVFTEPLRALLTVGDEWDLSELTTQPGPNESLTIELASRDGSTMGSSELILAGVGAAPGNEHTPPLDGQGVRMNYLVGAEVCEFRT